MKLKKSRAVRDTLEVGMVAGFLNDYEITYALIGKLTKEKSGNFAIPVVALPDIIAGSKETRSGSPTSKKASFSGTTTRAESRPWTALTPPATSTSMPGTPPSDRKTGKTRAPST